jgi:hypothetical protein
MADLRDISQRHTWTIYVRLRHRLERGPNENRTDRKKLNDLGMKKMCAPGEDRTHDLKIMRLTRCLLRYRGLEVAHPL